MGDTPLQPLQPMADGLGPGSSAAIDEPAEPIAKNSQHLQATPEALGASAIPPVQPDVFYQEQYGLDAHRSHNSGETEDDASQNPISEMGYCAGDEYSRQTAMMWQRLTKLEEQMNALQDRLSKDPLWQRALHDVGKMQCRASPASGSDRGYGLSATDHWLMMWNPPARRANQPAEGHDSTPDSTFEGISRVASRASTSTEETQPREGTSTGLRDGIRWSCDSLVPGISSHHVPDVNTGASSSNTHVPPVTQTAPTEGPSSMFPPIGGEQEDRENACILANLIKCYGAKRYEKLNSHTDDTDSSLSDTD